MNIKSLKNRVKKLENTEIDYQHSWYWQWQLRKSPEEHEREIKDLEEKLVNERGDRKLTPEELKFDAEMKDLDDKYEEMKNKIAEEKLSSRSG